MQDLGGAGVGPELDLGWRIDARCLVGAYGEFALLSAGEAAGSNRAMSAAAGRHAQVHLLPNRRFDPWLASGSAGVDSGDLAQGTYGLHGLDLARVRAGVDYRMSPRFAIGPVLGVTFTEFLWGSPAGGLDPAIPASLTVEDPLPGRQRYCSRCYGDEP